MVIYLLKSYRVVTQPLELALYCPFDLGHLYLCDILW